MRRIGARTGRFRLAPSAASNRLLTGAVRAEIEPPAVSWKTEAFSVVNNGHTIQANVSPGGFATSAGRKYELQQFHFHAPRVSTRWAASGRRWRYDKKRARLNTIAHLLSLIPYEELPRDKPQLSKRQKPHGYAEPNHPHKYVPELGWPVESGQ